MIRFSTENDIKGIIALWNEAFGDSEKEISFFLDNCYYPQNALVYEADGEIASMLFLLEGNMCINKTDYPSYYLYAACTQKKYRGRGMMAELLQFARTVANERKKHFICLKPGEKNLFDFYEKHGYKTVFYVKKSEYINPCFSYRSPGNNPDTIYNREKFRNRAFSCLPYFKWDKQAVDFAFLHNNFFGGSCSESCEGYSLYSMNSDVLTVKETTFTEDVSVLNSIEEISSGQVRKAIIFYPPYSFINEKALPYAMICSVNDTADVKLNEIDCAYLGLTLE